MPTDLHIRSVRSSDHDEWRPLWDGYNEFYGRSGQTALPETVTTTTWSRFFDPREPVHCCVAELDGHLVGITHYLFHRSTLAVGPSCYLQDLFTDAAVRGRGVGRALILHVRERAVEAGCGRLYWQTHETNETAMRLYDTVAERSGFLVYRMPV